MTKKKDLGRVLEERLSAFVGSGLPLFVIHYPNTVIEYDPDGVYLRPQVAVARSVPIGIADTDKATHEGLYQIDIFIPKGRGVSVGMDIAQQLSDHFQKGNQLDTGSGYLRMTGSDLESNGGATGSHFQMGLLLSYTCTVDS
jgi:Bacteriophage related domain of unknown function